MLELLKKQSLKQVIRSLGFKFGIMILILIIFGTSFIKSIQGPVELNSLPLDEIPNAYVEHDIEIIYDAFAEAYSEDEDGKQESTDMYYIIPLNEDKLIALHVDKQDFNTAEELFNDSYEYYIDQTTSEPPTTWKVKGTINKLEKEPLEYYNSYFLDTAEFTQEDIDTYTMPYVLEVNYIGKYDSTITIGAFVIFILLLLYTLYTLMKGLSGININPIKKYIKEHEDSLNPEKLEADYQNGKSIDNVKVGEIWTFFFNGAKAQVVKNEDLIWIYREERTHRFYGFKVYNKKSLTMFTKDKKKYKATIKDSSDIDYVIETISQDHPHIVTGYSTDLEKCFKNDFESFIQIPYTNEKNTENSESNEATNEQEFD